ncbi:hypothetical protein GT755_37655 [Herbidospora sp. NEAU-GS84]|uniref:DUF4258 domain-containing protein n=1 Tax=Herbidospora solisilvae TaxID=2696284 RepID=A0A7C9J8C9_9ACTN|nr:hypothetical protein [Herbidospora solisilvae]NAS27382.1 hypothetical protein [Herbidospora solisilvae]
MTYSINFHAAASAQIPGLPERAFLALLDELAGIGADPHHRGVAHPEDAAFREQVFGGVGLVSFVVDDATKVVTVYSITWAG